jgi:hypothetical protein
MKLILIRKVKALFIRYRLHAVVDWLLRPLLTLSYLSALSRWIAETPMPGFDDFYSRVHDYGRRYGLYRHVVEQERLEEICYLEFGVAAGRSMKWWVENCRSVNSRFYGFDTFEGLPERWGSFGEGAMSTEGDVPQLDDPRCEFVKGLFQQTLPAFLQSFDSGQRKVIHLDADLYSSTLFVLTALHPVLRKDDILLFDEFNVPLHEFRAFMDFTAAYRAKYEVIACVNNYYQMAVKLV